MEMENIILILILIIFFYITFFTKFSNLVYMESYYDGNKYLVQDNLNKKEAAILLSKIIERLKFLKNYLVRNIDNYKEYEEYILLINKNFNDMRTSIYEGDGKNNLTSYSVNKGEELVLCLHSKKTKKLHDINLMMYIGLHELAHMGCPEIGHTELFTKIFKFLTLRAIDLNLYRKEDFASNPREYCGMELYTSVV